ncbi:MAG: sterol desaturase family protein [Rhizobiaceae bacterium]|nr:sterol desaturase family protein [Rhizobiaceae bacterium]MCZ8351653.1 sterol desaturase family protein [Rhizobium sp.]
MDDLKFGTRNKRGDWSPDEPIKPAPLLDAPSIARILKWLPSYFFPYNVLWLFSAWVFLTYLTPSRETLQTLDWQWPLYLLVRNSAAVFLFYGVYELRLYVQRKQGNRFKFNARFPSDSKNAAFMFGSQNIDSMIRGFGTGVPIWTAFEVLVLWSSANGYGFWLTFAEHPIYLIALFVLSPVIHEIHFFAIHRLIHTPVLYKWIHSVHHNSVNPSPFSSLSMHPVEHLLYFGTVVYHIVLPSNPLLAIYQLHMAGFGAVIGHVGFDKIEVGDEKAIDTHAYAHYLHHKYFEVNYADGLIPLDKWFGTWHDGTKEGDAQMQARYEKRKAKANAQPAE